MTNTIHNHDNSTTSTCTGTSSSAGARARSIEANVLRGWYNDACEYFVDNFRRAPGPGVRREIAEAIKSGMTGECLMAIMDEAQGAPRPSWAYCLAILRRCQGAGIKTLEDWQTDKERANARKNPALNYTQREYTDDMFGPDFYYHGDL